MKFYNTLTRRLEEFREIEKGRIGLYTCGPTVYDYPHIGNYRSYVFEDLVKRFFLFLGYRVTHVMNITDIDDKTIRKANELGVPLAEVTQKYIDAFHADLRRPARPARRRLPARHRAYPGNAAADHPGLLEKGFAYDKDGSVYFSIESFPEYGRSGQPRPRQPRSPARRDATPTSTKRRAVQDFVLWKGHKAGRALLGPPLRRRAARAGTSNARP